MAPQPLLHANWSCQGGSQAGRFYLFYWFVSSFQPAQQDCLVHLVALVMEWLQTYYDVLQELSEEELISMATGDSGDLLESATFECQWERGEGGKAGFNKFACFYRCGYLLQLFRHSHTH